MKEIVHHKFSLFLLEKDLFPNTSIAEEFGSDFVESCFKYVETFNSLDEAQDVQKQYKQKSIILTSY